ncbi:xaa-Arg dipeptidase-like isoform X4 [Dermacentor albipictus]|uniref:xaa-Arg dipeptidase-like isoform X4 n=1 Tax=Dermacentor albipictus TaxID=60249 RepID=UPI0031FDC5D2
MAADFSSLVRNVLEAKANELWDVSKFLWANPETALRETKAHDRLCEFLERQGFNVSRRHYMDTAFRAEYSAPGGTDGPTVALMAEYDALPDIGHGCGHNLVSQSVLGAAVAVKEVMNKVTNLSGKIVVLGTPAEEDNVGKITLLEKGAFDDINVAMTAHPGAQDVLKTAFSASQKLTVTYTGKAAHAAVSPWDGVNAADAAVSAYFSLAMLRHRIKDTSRILALIEDCGQYPNIITESSRLVCHVLTPDPDEDLDALQARAERCLCAAAHATGCKATIARGRRCRLFAHNDALVRAYRSHGTKLEGEPDAGANSPGRVRRPPAAAQGAQGPRGMEGGQAVSMHLPYDGGLWLEGRLRTPRMQSEFQLTYCRASAEMPAIDLCCIAISAICK